jgi:hypothetical protein
MQEKKNDEFWCLREFYARVLGVGVSPNIRATAVFV